MDTAEHFLSTLAIVLCVAAVTTVLFQRLKQPVVLGYLLAGMIVGPYIPIPVEADTATVHTLSELGVILLMFSLGAEFSLQKLLRVGPTAALIAIVQCSAMVWIGFIVGQALGWTWLESVYAGAIIAISSTTIIVKAFGEQQIKGDFTEIVFGVLIVEDLIAILLITILTTLSSGQSLTAGGLMFAAGRLALFLAVLIVAGMLTIPRLTRLVVRLDRPETTVVASTGLAFGFALIALQFGYSVALGAFIAGSLVGESGVETTVNHLVRPVRDIFAAIFFVSIGMLIDPALIATQWLAVLAFLVIVMVGMPLSVACGALLTGQSVPTAIRAGMSLTNIGEFSFIIAGVGTATAATGDFLFPIAVAVSAVTTLLTPWLIQASDPVATLVDRVLPRPLQTFVALYGSWLEQLKSRSTTTSQNDHIRGLIRWLAVDAIVATIVVIVASIEMGPLTEFVQGQFGLGIAISRLLVIVLIVLLSAPFWFGIVRVSRYLGVSLADRIFPPTEQGQLDLTDAPRRLLVVTLQLAIVVLIGAPVVAITQPFVRPLHTVLIVFLLVSLLSMSFWRNATNLQGHTRAAAQVIAEVMAQRTRENRVEADQQSFNDMGNMLVGLGSPVPVTITTYSPVVGKTLAAVNLRGRTGATILAIRRDGETLLVPDGREVLKAGDALALAGASDAIESAKELLTGQKPADAAATLA